MSRSGALVAWLVAAGCAPSARAPLVVRADACRSGVTLWLDFEGAGVVHAAADDSAAMPVASSLAPSSAVIPPFSSTEIAPKVSRAAAIAAIVDRVRTLLLPFAVDVVTSRPPSAPYTRILVGGTAGTLGVTATEAGLATVDCGNAVLDDVAYDFAAAQTPDYGGVVGIANTAAHEAGHTFGLEHVDDAHDVMYAAAQPALTLPDLFTLRFGNSGSFTPYGGSSTRQCTSSDPVDEPALLGCAVGAAPTGGDRTPPTLDWPLPRTVAPPSLSLYAVASDNVGVARVEVYKNLELIASLPSPPYPFTVDVAPSEHFYLTVEAIDAAGNRTTLTRALAAVAGPPAADAGVPSDLATAPSIEPTPRISGGCAVAAPPGAVPLPLLLVVAALATASYRSSGSGSSWRRRR